MGRTWVTAAVAVGAAALLAASAVQAQPAVLSGAGATFPFPLYSRWLQAYAAEKGARVLYRPVGSGAGIEQFLQRTVDFAGTDSPLTDDQAFQAGGVLHLPMVAGAVAFVYRIEENRPPPTPGAPSEPRPSEPRKIPTGLNFTPEVLAAVLLGTITKWDDPRIVELNPQLTLPAEAPIKVVRRADASGTTAILTNYLSKVSPEWKQQVGEGLAVRWPAEHIAAVGSAGVIEMVKKTPNSVGYVELAYAVSGRMTIANVRNKAGRYVIPSLTTTTKAMEIILSAIPQDYRVFFTNSEGLDAYPIAGFTWIVITAEQPDEFKGRALVDFLWWATHTGQQYAPALLYVPLPRSLVTRVEQTLRMVTANGAPLRP